MSLLTFMEDPTIPAWYKKQKWDTAPQGAKNEYYYEKYARNPTRNFLGGGDPKLNPLGSKIANAIVPPDLESAGQLAAFLLTRGRGGSLGQFGAGMLGGTAGGMAQGRPAIEAAGLAAPGALLAGVSNYGMTKTGAYKEAISNQATGKLSAATQKLFRQFWKNNPDLVAPATPNEMRDFYGSGQASPAIQRTGKALGDFRAAIKRQPAFAQAKPIQAPIKWIDPVTGTPRYGTVQMSLGDAIDYQQGLYGKGYMISGGPRGGIMAEPDRALAGEMRQKILDSMKSIPRSGPHLAARYDDLSHDYGVAQTIKDVFTKDTVTPEGLLNHEKVYGNLADQKRLSHLNNLVGPQATRDYVATVAPQGQRIDYAADPTMHPRARIMGVHVGLPKSPIVPPQFVPPVSRAIGPAIGQSVTNFIESGNE